MARERLSKEERQKVARAVQDSAKPPKGMPKYLDFDGKMPKVWTPPKKGTARLDIIPFQVSIDNGPVNEALRRPFKTGEEIGRQEVYVHKYIGPEGKDVVCPLKNYGKPCPLCERSGGAWSDWRSAPEGTAEEKVAKEDLKEIASKLTPQKRSLYNLIDLKAEDDLAGEIQIFDAADYVFQNELKKAIDQYEEEHPDEEGAVVVDDLDEGFTVKCYITQKSGSIKGKSFTSPVFSNFTIERRKPYDPEIFDRVWEFDKMLIQTPYDTIETMYLAGTPKKNEEPAEVEDDVPEEEDDVIEEKAAPVTSKTLLETPEPEEEEVEEIEEEKEKVEEKPKVVNKPRPRVKREVEKPSCPNGFKFGADCDAYDECVDCPVDTRNKCYDAYEASQV